MRGFQPLFLGGHSYQDNKEATKGDCFSALPTVHNFSIDTVYYLLFQTVGFSLGMVPTGITTVGRPSPAALADM
ncbi:MAG: hypothetical protein GY702_18285 [Desulfobulbaceae bacterium]|nr:hypothetical protein [Desulfobulbaceae bacterium]